MAKENTSYEDQIKLYEILVDQLQRYNSVIWQIPTALIAANVLAIDKFFSNPYFLFCLSIFNYVLIYVFHRMLIQQRAIIEATQSAEKKLSKKFSSYIPVFPQKKISSTKYFKWTLVILNSILLIFAVYILYCNCDGHTG